MPEHGGVPDGERPSATATQARQAAPAGTTDAQSRISDWDRAKECFVRIFDEADMSVKVIEQEKARILNLTQALSEIHDSFEKLQFRSTQVERRVTTFEQSHAKLNYKIDTTAETVRGLKQTEGELLSQTATLQAAIADIQRHSAEQSDRIAALVAENAQLRHKIGDNDRSVAYLVGEIARVHDAAARQEARQENRHSAAPVFSAPVPGIVRAPAIPESTIPLPLAADSLPAPGVQTGPADVAMEQRDALSSTLAASIEQHRAEISQLQIIAQGPAEEPAPRRTFEIGRSAAPPTVADDPPPVSNRVAAEIKLAELRESLASVQAMMQELERASLDVPAPPNDTAATVAAPTEATATPVAAEPAPAPATTAEAEPGADSSADLRLAYEKRAEELKAALTQERLERKFAEGALHAARTERAQLQRELARLRATTRSGVPLDAVPDVPRLREPDDPEREPSAA